MALAATFSRFGYPSCQPNAHAGRVFYHKEPTKAVVVAAAAAAAAGIGVLAISRSNSWYVHVHSTMKNYT
jgi:hypothetical protein